MQACSINVADCEIVVTVAASAAGGRQADVVAAISASRADFAQLIVGWLRAMATVDDWDVVDSPRLPQTAAAAKAPPPQPGPEPAVSDVVPPPPAHRIVAGCLVPTPPPGEPAFTEVPPPPPPAPSPIPVKAAPTPRPWTAAEAWGATPRDVLPARTIAGLVETVPATRELDMRTRLAKAEEYGRAARLLLAGNTLPGFCWPSPLPATTPALKNRIWVVLAGPAGFYDRWDSVIAAGGNVPGSGVHGFASLTEARAYAAAAGCTDLARR